MKHISMIGLGAMGSALTRTLLNNRYQVTVWNRSPDKAIPLVAAGAQQALSVADAIRSAPLVLVSVLDYAVVRAILEPASDALAGRTIVNLTNGTPAQARELSAWVLAHEADYIDGAIMTTPELVGQPDAFVLYAGAKPAFRQWERTLAALGQIAYVGEDPALAALHDLALLSAMFGMFGGYLHAAALLRSEHIAVSEATPGIVSLLKAMADLLPQTAREIDSGEYPEPTSNNAMMAASLKSILEGSAEQGVTRDIIAPISALFRAGSSRGLGHLDISALVPLLAATPDPALARAEPM